MIQIKGAYERLSKDDGKRILVERLVAARGEATRGVKKEEQRLDQPMDQGYRTEHCTAASGFSMIPRNGPSSAGAISES